MLALVCVALLASARGGTPSAAQGSTVNFVAFRLGADPLRPGDTVEIYGEIADNCQPGSIEVGLADAPFEDWGAYRPTSEDPRSGVKVVLANLDEPPGADFSFEVELPDIGTDEPLLYLICEYLDAGGGVHYAASFGNYPLVVGEASDEESEGPTEAVESASEVEDGAPVARPDRAEVDASGAWSLPAPGVLANDEDPAGDQLVAVRRGAAATIAGRLSFRPDGSVEFTPRGADPGAVCVAYVARNTQRLTSNQTTLVLLVGDVGDVEAAVASVVDQDGCRPAETSPEDFELDLIDGEGDLPGTLFSSASSTRGLSWPVDDEPLVLAAPPEFHPVADPAALRVPRHVRCDVSTCLWGYYGPPYYGCVSTVTGSVLSQRYGSQTGYAYLRKGYADYVDVRPLFYQDGTRLEPYFTWGEWKRYQFPYLNGPQTFNRYVWVKMHQRFGAPGSSYQVGFQARWYRDRAWARDEIIAMTTGAAVLPYTCVSGGLS